MPQWIRQQNHKIENSTADFNGGQMMQQQPYVPSSQNFRQHF